jgi:ribosome-associated protein
MNEDKPAESQSNVVSIGRGVEIPLSEISFTFSRSGGPGGQNVNKVNSKAIMRWSIANTQHVPAEIVSRFMDKFGSRVTVEGDLVLTSQRYRDQPSNVSDCLEKLQEMLGSVLERPIIRRATKPSKSSQIKRVDTKRVHSKLKAQRRSSYGDD